MEQIYNEITTITFGQQAKILLQPTGDLLYNLSLICVLPAVTVSQLLLDATNFPGDLQRYTIAKFAYVTNLGCSLVDKATFNIENQPAD